jgi:response regulator RpfG family c-di-GMP phosphodiesterase
VTESPLLAAVDRVAHIVATERNLSTLLRKCVDVLGRALRASTAYVFGRRTVEDREEFNLMASWAAEKTNGKTPLRVSRTVMRQASREGTTILVSHAGTDARFSAQESIVSQGLESILCAPLRVQNRVFGILYAADSEDAKGFSSEDMELLTAVAAQIGLAIAISRAQHRHDAFFRKAMRILVAAIEHRLPQQKGASERIAGFCAAIARAMHLDAADVRFAWIAGLLHDVAVLGLSDRELEEAILLPIRRTRAAEELLSHLADLAPVLDAIRDQDERFDGSGQPEGKQGDAVPLLAQILGLAKYFDSLLSGEGPVATGGEMPVRDAVLRVNELKGKQFPVRVVNGLLVAYRQGQLFQPDQNFSLAL